MLFQIAFCMQGPLKQEQGASSSAGGWTGETYEADAVKAVDTAFIKFTKRLRRRPEQCLRFG